MPKVSIITPCYNAERFLTKAIQSVVCQTFTSWEQVIIDDGSTDRSAEIACESAKNEARVRLVKQPNRGVNSARNAGFRAAAKDSEYLLFLDADDILAPEMIATMSGYLDAHPEAVMAVCRYAAIDEQGNSLPDIRSELPRYTCRNGKLELLAPTDPRIPFDTALWWIDLPIMSCLIRRRAYEKLPGWDESFQQGCEDTDLLLRFFLLGEVHSVPEVLVYYRKHAGQATKSFRRMKAGRRVLHEKWLAGNGLTAEEASRFREEWRRTEGIFLPRHLLRESAIQLARGRVVRSAKLAVKSAAHYAISRTLGCRQILWPSLWYLA